MCRKQEGYAQGFRVLTIIVTEGEKQSSGVGHRGGLLLIYSMKGAGSPGKEGWGYQLIQDNLY